MCYLGCVTAGVLQLVCYDGVVPQDAVIVGVLLYSICYCIYVTLRMLSDTCVLYTLTRYDHLAGQSANVFEKIATKPLRCQTSR